MFRRHPNSCCSFSRTCELSPARPERRARPGAGQNIEERGKAPTADRAAKIKHSQLGHHAKDAPARCLRGHRNWIFLSAVVHARQSWAARNCLLLITIRFSRAAVKQTQPSSMHEQQKNNMLPISVILPPKVKPLYFAAVLSFSFVLGS